MKLLTAKKALTAASVVVAAGVVPLVTATPASAGQDRCVNYLGNLGIYQIGPKVKAACRHGAWHAGGVVANPACLSGLINIGVRLEHAQAACISA